MQWKDGKLVAATLRSKLGNNCTIRYGEKSIDVKTGSDQSYNLIELLGG